MSEIKDPYDDQLRAARYRAERDLARDQLERANRKICELEAEAVERRTVRAEDREAAEWVRDHGGLDVVETRWDNDTQLADAVIYALWPYGMPDGGGNEDVMDELSKRLMPEGYEWPRFEDGEPVRVRDVAVLADNEPHEVESMEFFADKSCKLKGKGTPWMNTIFKGQVAKRHAPKVLDADGVEIGIGDKLYDTETGCARIVRAINASGTVEFEGYEDRGWFTNFLTHRAPVLAADGEPLEVGQTVWHVATGVEYTVRDVTSDGAHLSKGDRPGGYCRAKYLTHQRPVLDADGVPIKVGDMVWYMSPALGYRIKCRVEKENLDGSLELLDLEVPTDRPTVKPENIKLIQLIEPGPSDSWERLEEDAEAIWTKPIGYGKSAESTITCRAVDLVRRAKALAEKLAERGK